MYISIQLLICDNCTKCDTWCIWLNVHITFFFFFPRDQILRYARSLPIQTYQFYCRKYNCLIVYVLIAMETHRCYALVLLLTAPLCGLHLVDIPNSMVCRRCELIIKCFRSSRFLFAMNLDLSLKYQRPVLDM